MFLPVPPKNVEKALQIFDGEDVQATAIGRLTSDKTLNLSYQGQTVAKVDVDFLFSPPETSKTAKFVKAVFEEPKIPDSQHLTQTLLTLLASPNIASKESVVRTYDHEVKGNTVLKPFQGEQAGPHDAAILKPLNDSWKGVVISCGMNPNYGKIDKYRRA